MVAPSTPVNFFVQQGNGQVYLSWSISVGSTSYPVLRSTDNVNFTQIAAPTDNSYLDTTALLNTQYYYKVQASNGTVSPPTQSQGTVATLSGVDTLASLRLQAQQRADRVNSNFVTMPEWNKYINQSMLELYDLLVTVYEDYYLAAPFTFNTTGAQNYQLPNGIITDINNNVGAQFYKLMGVDCAVSGTAEGKITIHKYDFIERNRYVYPNVTSSFFGVFNLRYRVMGDKINFIPAPQAGQQITLHYIPRLPVLLKDTDVADFVSGWSEYIIVDAAIKALQKEESDVTVLGQEKLMLIKRIEDSAMNRDAGQPDTISNTRVLSRNWGPGFDGSSGGV